MRGGVKKNRGSNSSPIIRNVHFGLLEENELDQSKRWTSLDLPEHLERSFKRNSTFQSPGPAEPLGQVQTLTPDFSKAQYLGNCSQHPIQRALSGNSCSRKEAGRQCPLSCNMGESQTQGAHSSAGSPGD